MRAIQGQSGTTGESSDGAQHQRGSRAFLRGAAKGLIRDEKRNGAAGGPPHASEDTDIGAPLASNGRTIMCTLDRRLTPALDGLPERRGRLPSNTAYRLGSVDEFTG